MKIEWVLVASLATMMAACGDEADRGADADTDRSNVMGDDGGAIIERPRPPPVQRDASLTADASRGGCVSDSDCAVLESQPVGCSEAICAGGACVYRARDADGDGDRTTRCQVLGADVVLELGKDCDDADADANSMVEERCDGKDNDCSGETDEDVPQTMPCEAGKGVCRAFGVMECVDGSWSGCSAVPGTPESGKLECDKVDHDCDGSVDDKTGCVCKPGETMPRARLCAPEVAVVCLASFQWAEPEPGPQKAHYCEDHDGDGAVDASHCGDFCPNTQPSGYVAQGPGISFDCNDGRADARPNGQEVCDGVDNDCDGAIDEDALKACGCGVHVACNAACAACPAGFSPDPGNAGACLSDDEQITYVKDAVIGAHAEKDFPRGCGIRDDRKVVGGACGDGLVRSSMHIGVVPDTGNGNCSGRWENDNPDDCSVRMHFGTGWCDAPVCHMEIRARRRVPRCQ